MASITFGTRTKFKPNSMRVALEAVAARRARAACEAVGPQVCQFIAEEAAASTDVYYRPHRSKSLHAASSYRWDVSRQANGARLNITIADTSSLFAAKFFSVNFGSKDHDVYPRGAYMLVWPEKGSMRKVKAWKTHPSGITGRHFYEAGIQRGIALIPGAL